VSKNTIIISVVSGLVLLGFLVVVYTLTTKPVQTDFPQVNKIATTDHVKWSADKKNVLVEYGDFQCPACRVYHQFLADFEASSSANSPVTKKVTFVYRNFPLFQVHKNAYPAAYAAEAAAKQDKFWQMHDLLYQKQDGWAELANPTDYFVGLAQKLNLNLNKFKTDLNSQEVRNKVEADLQSGNLAQISSTPGFFYNGQKLNIQSPEQLKQAISGNSP